MGQTLERFLASGPADAPHVRGVEASRTLAWLRMGAQDYARMPGVSLVYGAVITGFGMLLLSVAWGASYLVPALVGGFLLVAPFAAIGLYALSQQAERGQPVDARASYTAWRRNAGSIALFGLMLALALIFWERIAAIVFALFYGVEAPDLPVLATQFLAGQHIGFVAAFLAAGAAVAAAVFALSVVSAPLLYDRPLDVVTAGLTSLRCCLRNPGTMLLWAVLIALLTALGFATAMLGLVFIFPWLGYASWHAYREMVEF